MKLLRSNLLFLTLGLGLVVLVLLNHYVFHFNPLKWGSENEVSQEQQVCKVFKFEGEHPGMVWVPAGSSYLGDSVYPEEKIKLQKIAGFWMDEHEVTNYQFAEFVKATGYQTLAERKVNAEGNTAVFIFPNQKTKNLGGWKLDPTANWRHPGGIKTSIDGKENFPVTAISYEDAQAYATWLGKTLPSEAQWEWAARSAKANAIGSVDDHHQPLSTDANTFQGIFPIRNTADDGFVGLAPVGCFTPNALGLYDMIGNVWEFTSDSWIATSIISKDSEASVPDIQRVGIVNKKIIKGGSFLCSSDFCMRYRPGARAGQDIDLGASHLGFRTVKN